MRIVDPANPIPKYLQISGWLKEVIEAGRYGIGDRLPSEVELSRMCRVNRNTVRQAIAELNAAGVVKKEKGKGTFVSSSTPLALTHKFDRITSFGEDLNHAGIREKTKLLKKTLEEPKEYVARTLFVGKDSRVFTIRRLRTGDGVPFIYEESYLPQDMFQGILDMDLTGSMYKIFSERFGMVLARSEQSIRAVNLKGKIARILQVPENSAGIFMVSVTYNEKNIPLEVLFSYYRGDRYVFEIEVGNYRIQEDTMKVFE